MSPQWMPLYIGDFLADTMHLSATETGIYIRLLMHCWAHGSIPLDDQKLARIAGCDSRLWHKYRETALRFFDVVEGSTAQHRRVNIELARCAEISNKRKAAALQMHSKSSANAHTTTTTATKKKEKDSLRSSQKKLAAPLPPDWKPDRVFARLKGMTEAQIDEQEQRFRDHAAANNRKQADWTASWRNWVTSPFQRAGPVNGTHRPLPRPGSRDDTRERTINALRKLDPFA